MDKAKAARVLEHLERHNMAFCYGTEGQFYTIGECKSALGYEYTEGEGWKEPARV